jgi:hypothetical protein
VQVPQDRRHCLRDGRQAPPLILSAAGGR